ncbi:MAG: APC family permease [Candidatus Hydrogenedentota bacterium]
MAEGSNKSTGGELQRSINLVGAVALVAGAVVGAGIFVQVQPIAAGAGGAIWLAFIVSIVISIFGVIPIIELSGALPRAGAGFLFGSRLLSPFLGWLTSYCLILGGGASTTVVALTLAKYVPLTHALAEHTPIPASDHLNALIVLLGFYIVYQVGMRLAMSLQVLMAVQFVTALLVYGIAGLFHVELDAALVPHAGAGPFIEAVLLAYATCMGFQVIAEMGEEIKDARRNIPLALILGGVVVAIIYILVGQVYISTQPLHAPGAFAAFHQPLTESGTPFLGPFWLRFLGFGAVTAGLTSLNAAALAIPREFFAQARDGVGPAVLARVSPRTHSPNNAVTLFFLFVVLLIAGGQGVDFYGLAAAIGILSVSSMLSLAALRLPRVYPERHAGAYIQFSRTTLILCAVITIGVSLAMGIVLALEAPVVVGLYAVWLVLAVVLYLVYTRRFTPEDWARLEDIPGKDEDTPAP